MTGDASAPKLEVGKLADGDVVCLRFAGNIDEDFDRKALPPVSGARVAVLHLADVNRISSFGIRQWVDFMQHLEKQVDNVVMIACSPKVVDQLNMVANFAGDAQVYSFAATYQCDYCDRSEDVEIRADDDWQIIKDRKLADRPCTRCGEMAYFDGDQVSYLAHFVAQGKVELDSGVAKFLTANLGLEVSATSRRMRVEKAIIGRFVTLKLSGDLDSAFPLRNLADSAEGNVVFDLSEIGVIDPDGIKLWGELMARIAQDTERVFLDRVPAAFAVKVLAEGVDPHIEVMSVAIPYKCDKCEVASSHLLDLDRNFTLLHEGQPPPRSCPDCRGRTTCIATDEQRHGWRRLPKPTHAAEARKAVRKLDKSSQRDAKSRKQRRRGSRGLGRAVVLGGAALVAAVVVAGVLKFSKDSDADASPDALSLVRASADTRPDWFPEQGISYGACEPADAGVVCVGVSSHARSESEARAEAQAAALDAIAMQAAEQINDAQWTATVRSAFEDARTRQLEELEAIRTGPQNASYNSIIRRVRNSRSQVAELLRDTAGAALPSFEAERYFEEYRRGTGDKVVLVAVKFVVSADQLARVGEIYTERGAAMGATAVLVFPGLAWRYPELTGGVVVVDLDEGELKTAGLAVGETIVEIQYRRISRAENLTHFVDEELERLREKGGVLTFRVTGADGTSREIGVPVEAKPTEEPRARRPRRKKETTAPGSDTWNQTGGSLRDDPTR